MKKILLATLLLATPALATYTPQAIITDAVSGKMATVDSSNALKVAGTVNIGTTGGLALDATLAALSAKLPSALGAHSIANSTAVNIASDQVVAVSVSSLPLPSGGATAALQTTANTSLASIDGKIVAVNTGAVVVASSALPSGGATSALQGTGNTSLASIDSTLSTLNGKVTAVNTGAVVVASSALPTGAATAANQATEISSLATIATNTTNAGTPTVNQGTPGVGAWPVLAAQAGSWTATVTQATGSNLHVVNDAGSAIIGKVGIDQTTPGTTNHVYIGTDGTVGITGTVPLPNGAATAALQTTGNTSLASIDGKITAVNTGAVVVASSALPSGAATESTLSTLNGKVPSGLTVTSTRLLVDGSGVTQPISAAALPLPSGAATAAKQPALGTAGSASADVITVQGVTSMTPLLVNNSANTQPTNLTQVNGNTALAGNGVTGTGSPRVTIASDNTAFSVNAIQSGTWNVTNISGTVSLPTGAATAALQTTGNTSLSSIDGKITAVNTGAVVVSSSALPSGASTEATLSTLNGKIPSSLTVTSTRLLVDPSGVTSPVSIATAPVLVAGSAIIGKVGIDQTTPGTTNGVQVNAALPAGSAVIGKVSIDQTTPGTTNLVALAANQSVNVAQINGVTPLMGAGNTGTGSARVTIATDQAAVAVKPAIAVTGSGSAAAATVSTVITATAPSNAVGFILQNMDTSTANIRWAVGRTATTTLGQQLQPGRDSGFVPIGASVTIVAESGTQTYDIQWIAQ